jgi:hypothetical protein
MKKNITLFYLLDTSAKSKCDFILPDEDFTEFNDVFQILEQCEAEPEPFVIQQILKYAAST